MRATGWRWMAVRCCHFGSFLVYFGHLLAKEGLFESRHRS